MPLSVNIGLSKKMSRDYQSAGVSVNLTAELDATLLTKPDLLQSQIDNLYAQARQALNRQADRLSTGNSVDNQSQESSRSDRGNGNGQSNGREGRRGNSNGNTTSRRAAPATSSQLRAINAIGRRLNIDPTTEAKEIIGAGLDELTISQASDLIDHLKALQPARNGGGRNGGGR